MVSDDELSQFRQEITLLDGRQVTIRLIGPEDKKALLAFHTHLSEETRLLRYQYLKGDLTEDDLKNFCEIDYNNSLALVAEEGANGQRELIGVGRYYRLAYPDTAEVAFVVRDCDQKKGVGTQLLKQLALLAWQKDIHYFVAEVLRRNGKMLSIFRKSDPGMTQEADDTSSCTVRLSVAAAMHRSPK
jgi:L-amino acid N-acyltransferase YncA